MSINDIELSPIVISELYGDRVLVAKASPAAPTTPASASSAAPPVKTLGSAAPSVKTLGSAAPPVKTLGSAAPFVKTPVEPATPGSASSPPGYRFLGNNKKKISILVNSPETGFLSDDQLAFLTKMLEACKMNIGDVAIINQASSPVLITELRRQLAPSIILLFGMEPIEIALPINFAAFKVQTYDQCTYLCAPSLDQLVSMTEESKLLKGKLWACLKTLFQI